MLPTTGQNRATCQLRCLTSTTMTGLFTRPEPKNKASYDQLTLTNSGGIRGRRTRADEKCVECEVQSGASGVEDI